MKTRESLEVSITELTILLNLSDVKEDEFQKWFERHPVVFNVLGYRRNIPHPQLHFLNSTPMIPDFIVQRPDGLWEIFEIKRPDASVLKNPVRRTAFYSDMNTYVAQCLEYSERCSDSHVAQMLLETYGIIVNPQPESILIAGRNNGLDRLKVHGILKRFTPKIRHLTFDDVLDALQQHYVSNFSGNTDGPGLSIYACICLTSKDLQSKECLFDLGHSKICNRITLTRFQDRLVNFSVFDDDGLQFSQDINIAKHCEGRQFVCAIHITHTPTSALVLFEINGCYVGEHQLAKGSLALVHPLPYVVAADMEGKRCASLIIGSQLIRDPALTIIERAQLREVFFDNLRSTSDESVSQEKYGLLFSKGQFMYTEGHPFLDANYARTTNLVQRVDERKPTLTHWPNLASTFD